MGRSTRAAISTAKKTRIGYSVVNIRKDWLSDGKRNMEAKTRRCSKCGVEYPASREYFSPDRRNKDGFQSACKACIREQLRQYRAAHKDIVSEQNRRYYRQQINERRIRARKHASENKGKRRDYIQRYRMEKTDELREWGRQYRAKNGEKIRNRKRQHIAHNRDKERGRQRRYYQENRDKVRLYYHRRKARKQSLPDTFTVEEWEKARDYWHNCCAYCGSRSPVLTIDHFIPLNSDRCIGTVPTNIVPACKPCNSSKGDRDAFAWLISQFGAERGKEIQARILTYFSLISL